MHTSLLLCRCEVSQNACSWPPSTGSRWSLQEDVVDRRGARRCGPSPVALGRPTAAEDPRTEMMISTTPERAQFRCQPADVHRQSTASSARSCRDCVLDGFLRCVPASVHGLVSLRADTLSVHRATVKIRYKFVLGPSWSCQHASWICPIWDRRFNPASTRLMCLHPHGRATASSPFWYISRRHGKTTLPEPE